MNDFICFKVKTVLNICIDIYLISSQWRTYVVIRREYESNDNINKKIIEKELNSNKLKSHGKYAWV